ESEIPADVTPSGIAAMRARCLEDSAGDPAMTLVKVRVRALEEGETAVLRFKGRLQVGGIVDGVRPGIAGEQLERVAETLLHVDGEAVVDGVAVGKLRVDAVEGNRHAEARGISGQLRERGLPRVAAV